MKPGEVAEFSKLIEGLREGSLEADEFDRRLRAVGKEACDEILSGGFGLWSLHGAAAPKFGCVNSMAWSAVLMVSRCYCSKRRKRYHVPQE